MSKKHLASHGTTQTYIIGFLLSIALTLGAYITTVNAIFTRWDLVWVIVALALVQLLVQLRFFLHLGSDSESRWNVILFYFNAVVLLILVFGSLWIMRDLDYHHDHQKSPQETEKYIRDEELIQQ